MTNLHERQKTTEDAAGKKIITRAQIVSRTRTGEKVAIRGGQGVVTIERTGTDRYAVNGQGQHSLEGLLTWLGQYHWEFGEAVFFAA